MIKPKFINNYYKTMKDLKEKKYTIVISPRGYGYAKSNSIKRKH